MATQGHPLAQTHNERHKKAAHDPQHLSTRQGGQEPPCRVKTMHFDGDKEGSNLAMLKTCFDVTRRAAPPCHIGKCIFRCDAPHLATKNMF